MTEFTIGKLRQGGEYFTTVEDRVRVYVLVPTQSDAARDLCQMIIDKVLAPVIITVKNS